MPNYVKYSTSIPSGSLLKGTVALGVTTASIAGPTSTTNWYAGITPASGKYVIYKTAATGDPDIFCPQTDQELFNFVLMQGGSSPNITSVSASLAWIGTQSNLMAANFEYENIVTSGLVLNYDAGFVGSYPTTASIWYDLSGNNNSGSLINGPTYSSANSGSIVFDGTNDYVTLPTSFGGLSTFTVNTWFYPTVSYTGSTQNAVITTTWNGGDINYYIGWGGGGFGTGTIAAGIYKNSFIVAGTFIPTLNTWYNVGLSLGSGQLKMYVNGNLFASVSTSAIPNSITGGIYLGKRWDVSAAGNEFFTGNIPQVQVYNRALLATEITQNYNAQKGRYGL